MQIAAWLISTGTCLAVLYGIYPWFDALNEIPRVEGMVYAGLNRFGWGVSVAWIIFACVKGYGGLINSFLSWKAFIPLGRLCFCVYLVSLHLQMILSFSQKQAMTFAPYNMVKLRYKYYITMQGIDRICFVCNYKLLFYFLLDQLLLFPHGNVVHGRIRTDNNARVPVHCYRKVNF